MITLTNNHIVVDQKRCQQCGACEAVCPVKAISMALRHDGTHEVIVDNDKCIRCQRCVKCCPSNDKGGGIDYFATLKKATFHLGCNENQQIRKASSSGGVAKTLIIESLRRGLVDGVYTLKRLDNYPSGEGAFYTVEHIPQYDALANSVYHSVMLASNIDQVKKCDRLMIVGTACQLRALEKALKGKYKELIKVCIFCKQQKTLGSTRFLARVMGCAVKPDATQKFTTSYRGDGWPGTVRINDKSMVWERAAQVPFGRRLWTVGGCNICGDPFGLEEGGDISLMDPWTIRQRNPLGQTLMVVNTQRGADLVGKIAELQLEPLSYEEALPALDIIDIKRKQALVPYFRGEKCTARVRWAGRLEQLQRRYLRWLVAMLPSRPFILYRMLCKLPDLRNIILSKNYLQK